MTPCREWRGARVRGYGSRWDKERKRPERLHRWVVAQIDGWEAIESKVVMHLCHNKACFRYDHLKIGTQSENMKQWADLVGHGSETHCKHGHEWTAESTYIRPEGWRECRVCSREHDRASALRRKERG